MKAFLIKHYEKILIILIILSILAFPYLKRLEFEIFYKPLIEEMRK
jgi:hypothetical protein